MNALEINDLNKKYASGEQALQGVSLSVESGDFFALLGANGAGKSTTIGILFSLVAKTSGRVKVYGIDIDENFPQARAHMGLVPQEFNCNQFKPVHEVLTTQAGYYGIPFNQAKRRAKHYLQKLDLWHKRDSEVRGLSGGMKRRLMVARALMNEPRLLVLDEPTAGVDIEIRHMMWEFMTELNLNGTTIILTTHYLEEAENLCRNVAIIDKGRIVENSPMQTLLSKLDYEKFVFYLDRSLPEAPRMKTAQAKLLYGGDTLEICMDGGTDISDVFSELATQNIRVVSMRNKTGRLEQTLLDRIKEDDRAD